VFYKKTIFQVQ